MSGPNIEVRIGGFRQRSPFDILSSLIGGGALAAPSVVPKPVHLASANHTRRWCSFHGKVCCMRHGKHQKGKILRGPNRN